MLSKLLDTASTRASIKVHFELSLLHNSLRQSSVLHFTQRLYSISSAFFRFLDQPSDRFESSHKI